MHITYIFNTKLKYMFIVLVGMNLNFFLIYKILVFHKGCRKFCHTALKKGKYFVHTPWSKGQLLFINPKFYTILGQAFSSSKCFLVVVLWQINWFNFSALNILFWTTVALFEGLPGCTIALALIPSLTSPV